MQSNEELNKIKIHINDRIYMFNRKIQTAETINEEIEYMSRVDELNKLKEYINNMERSDRGLKKLQSKQFNV
jgi:glutamyl-tRNA reductase